MTEDHEHEHDLEVAADALLAVSQAGEAFEEEEAAEHEQAVSDAPDAAEAVGPSPEEWEDRFKKIAARFKTYTRAVGTILEEDATDLLPCPLCEGAVPGFVNGHDAGRVADETVGAVQAFIGYEAPARLNVSRVNTRCETCGGLGELQTGSLVPQWETRVCDECHGCGFRGPGNPHDVPGSEIPKPGEAPNGPPTIDLAAALASIQERNQP